MILVRDLDRAVRDYETLGFAVTPDGAEAVLQPDKQVHLEAERTRSFCWRKLRSVPLIEWKGLHVSRSMIRDRP